MLAHTTFSILLEDKLIAGRIPELLSVSIPYAAAVLTLVYGIIMINKDKKRRLPTG